jgi:hypothetical protein
MTKKRTNNIDRALSVDNLLKSSFRDVSFTGEWAELLGEPELAGSWIIWGGSGCGKTAFALKLAKQLCKSGKILYNSLEEGKSKSFKLAVARENMKEVAAKIVFLNKEPIPELKSRLRQHKSPGIVIVDSLQYTQMKLADYISIKNEFPRKLFIWLSHEKNGEPDGRLAEKIRYDADVKIHVRGFRAFSVSRAGGGNNDYITIYERGALEYWGFNN